MSQKPSSEALLRAASNHLGTIQAHQILPAAVPSWKELMAGRRRGLATSQRASGAAPLARYSCPAAAPAAATTCRPLGSRNSYLPQRNAFRHAQKNCSVTRQAEGLPVPGRQVYSTRHDIAGWGRKRLMHTLHHKGLNSYAIHAGVHDNLFSQQTR